MSGVRGVQENEGNHFKFAKIPGDTAEATNVGQGTLRNKEADRKANIATCGGMREDDKYDCGSAQNAAHLVGCPLVGDGKGRTIEECYKDQEWCQEVADFLWFCPRFSPLLLLLANVHKGSETDIKGEETGSEAGQPTCRCGLRYR